MFRKMMITSMLLLVPYTFAQAETLGIRNPSGESAMAPALTTTPDGSAAILSWIEKDGNDYAMKLSRFRSGKFEAAREVARGRDWFANWADTPAVHARADGTWIAHWLEKSGDSTYAYDIRVAHSSDAGKHWSKPKTPHRDGTATEHGFVSYFPADQNRTGMVWLDGRQTGQRRDAHDHSGFMTLRTAMIDADGTPEPEQLIDESVCDCCQTASGMTALGPIVAYRNRTKDEIRDIAVARRTIDGWTEPRLVHADGWKIAGCPVNGPSLIARNMQVVVAWFTMADDNPRVRFAISADAGASFAEPVTLSPGAALGRVQLAWTGDDFALSWMEDGDGDARLRVARYSIDGALLENLALSAVDRGRVSGFPRMTAVGEKLLVAWTSSETTDGSRSGTSVITALVDWKSPEI